MIGENPQKMGLIHGLEGLSTKIRDLSTVPEGVSFRIFSGIKLLFDVENIASQGGACLDFCRDLPVAVDDRAVVSPAEGSPDVGPGGIHLFSHQIHCHLTSEGHRFIPLLADQCFSSHPEI